MLLRFAAAVTSVDVILNVNETNALLQDDGISVQRGIFWTLRT